MNEKVPPFNRPPDKYHVLPNKHYLNYVKTKEGERYLPTRPRSKKEQETLDILAESRP